MLSSDSAMLRFFQNLFTQDLNTFNSERYAQKHTENDLRMRHLAPKIWKFSWTPTLYGRGHLPRIPSASAMATLVSLTSSFHMHQRCYFFLARTLYNDSPELNSLTNIWLKVHDWRYYSISGIGFQLRIQQIYLSVCTPQENVLNFSIQSGIQSSNLRFIERQDSLKFTALVPMTKL